MKAKPIFCKNKLKLVEHVVIRLSAETKKDEKDLDHLYRVGVVAVRPGHSSPKASFSTIYIPAKKEFYTE
ncbi:MAG: hypothetical protein AAB404_02300 [Patescibacteria group bacterium]